MPLLRAKCRVLLPVENVRLGGGGELLEHKLSLDQILHAFDRGDKECISLFLCEQFFGDRFRQLSRRSICKLLYGAHRSFDCAGDFALVEGHKRAVALNDSCWSCGRVAWHREKTCYID